MAYLVLAQIVLVVAVVILNKGVDAVISFQVWGSWVRGVCLVCSNRG